MCVCVVAGCCAQTVAQKGQRAVACLTNLGNANHRGKKNCTKCNNNVTKILFALTAFVPWLFCIHPRSNSKVWPQPMAQQTTAKTLQQWHLHALQCFAGWHSARPHNLGVQGGQYTEQAGKSVKRGPHQQQKSAPTTKYSMRTTAQGRCLAHLLEDFRTLFSNY